MPRTTRFPTLALFLVPLLACPALVSLARDPPKFKGPLVVYKRGEGTVRFWNLNRAATITVAGGDRVTVVDADGRALLEEKDPDYGFALADALKAQPEWLVVEAPVGPDDKGRVAINLARVSWAQQEGTGGNAKLTVAFESEAPPTFAGEPRTFTGDAATRIGAALQERSFNVK